MSTINWAVLLPIVVYLIILYGVALLTAKNRGSHNFLEEYFLGSRSMGALVLAFTITATYASGSSFLGGPGMAWKVGLGWVLLAMIQVPTALLTLGVLGKKFAIVARRIDAVTLNDFLRARYESKAVVIAAACSVLIFFMAIITAQFVAGGRLLESVTGLSYGAAVAVFAGTVIIYTTLGGFRAVVLTDTIQGVVMLGGVLLLLFGVVSAGGGIESTVSKLAAIDPALLTPSGSGGIITKPFIMSFWILVGFGVVGLPFSAVRCMGYKDSKSMHRGVLISSAVLVILMLGMHLAGALGRAVMPEVDNVDRVIPLLAMQILSPVVAGIFLAGPMAAIMSSVDSQLLLASAAIVKDLYLNYINPLALSEPAAEARIRRMTLVSTAVLGVLPFIAAYNPPTVIVWINLFAFGGLETAFLLPTVLGLYWKRANAPGALASMAGGVCSFIIIQQFKIPIMGLHPIVPSIGIALTLFLAVCLLTPPPRAEIIKTFWGSKR